MSFRKNSNKITIFISGVILLFGHFIYANYLAKDEKTKAVEQTLKDEKANIAKGTTKIEIAKVTEELKDSPEEAESDELFKDDKDDEEPDENGMMITTPGFKKHLKSLIYFSLASERVDLEWAKEMYPKVLKNVFPEDHWQANYTMGVIYIKHEKYEEALIELNKGLKMNPKCARCYERRGAAYIKLGKVKESLSDYNKSISLENDGYAYFNRYLIYRYSLNDMAKGVSDLKNAMKYSPKNDIAYLNMIYLSLDKENLEEAKYYLEEYNKYIDESQQKWEIYSDMGNGYIKHAEYHKAIEVLNRGLKLNPNGELLFERRAVSYMNLNLLKESLADFKKSIEIKPNDSAYYNRYLLYSNVLNQPEKAIEDLKSSIKLDKKNIGSYYNLIIELIAKKRYLEAKGYLDLYSSVVDKNNKYYYKEFLLLKSFYHLKKEIFSEFFQSLNLLSQLNSEDFKRNEKQIDYSSIKTLYKFAIDKYLYMKDFSNALKTAEYALEAAQVNKDGEFEQQLSEDIKYIKKIKAEKDPKFRYNRYALKINS